MEQPKDYPELETVEQAQEYLDNLVNETFKELTFLQKVRFYLQQYVVTLILLSFASGYALQYYF